MKHDLRTDLERAGALAFERVCGRREFIEGFHRLSKAAKERPDEEALKKLYGWMFVPLSIWPVDVKGAGLHVLGRMARGRALTRAERLICGLLPEAPGADVCNVIAEHEHGVKAGSYEQLIAAQHKFDLIEQELAQSPGLMEDWQKIKATFEVEDYRNAKGIIRRRLGLERNFRPPDWKFSWKTEQQRFQNVFDLFCHRWDLYGMERDRPLLLKLTVNVTPYGTIIMVPRFWSFDPRRDLKWKAITRLHRARNTLKQGVKLSANRAERLQEAERARRLWTEATKAGLKGDRRDQWVMGSLGWDARTSESRLRRLLASGRAGRS